MSNNLSIEMDKRTFQKTSALLFVAALALITLGVKSRLDFALLPFEKNIVLQSDDAFYYYNIARNFANGHGVTFDQTTPNNGFHPLFFLISAGWYKIFASSEVPISASLITLSVCSVLSSVFLYLLLVRLIGNRAIALLAASIWLFHPNVFYTSFNGVETSLYLFLLFATLFYYHAFYLADRYQRNVLLGALVGVTCLARTEAIFLAVLLPMDVLLNRMVLREGRRFKLRLLFFRLLAMVGSFCFVTGPWFVWCLFQFGTIEQTSAQHLRLWALNHIQYHHLNYLTYALDIVKEVIAKLPGFFYDEFLTRLGNPQMFKKFVLVLLGGAVLASAFGFFYKRKREEWPPRLFLLMGDFWKIKYFFAYTLILTSYYSFYLLTFRHRYFYFYIGFLLICLSLIVHRIFWVNHRRVFTQTSLFIGAIALCLTIAAKTHLRYNAQRNGGFPMNEYYQFWDAAKFIRDKFPRQTIFGGFNCGIIGYMSERSVVNLDGIVNPEAMKSLKNHSLFQYIYQKKIEYLIDAKGIIDIESHDSVFFRHGYAKEDFDRYLRFVELVPNTSFYGGVAIYKVERDRLQRDFGLSDT